MQQTLQRFAILLLLFSGVSQVGNAELSFAVRLLYSYHNSINSGFGEIYPKKKKFFTPQPPPGNILTVSVSAGSDDAEQDLSSGSVSINSPDLELSYDGLPQLIGLRFNGITIPQGATINSAHLEFECDESTSEITSLIISGQDIDNAPTFTTATSNLSMRNRTSAQVNWNGIPSWTAGNQYPSPDIGTVIQEIINQPNWTDGNSLAIFVEGFGRRVAESFNGNPYAAPTLVVDYFVPQPEICDNGIDDDGDGLTDCDDPDCLSLKPQPLWDAVSGCPEVEIVKQVALNDSNLQAPFFSISQNPVNGSASIDSNGVVTYSPHPGFCGYDEFVYQVTNTVSGCSATASVFLTIGDNNPPVLYNVPADLTIACDEEAPAVSTLVYGVDACPDINLTFEETSTQQDGNACHSYTITRTWSATDLCGNTAVGTQDISVEDVTAPQLFRVYTLANGKKIAGGLTKCSTETWKQVGFPLNFDEVPLVFSQVISENEVSAVVVRQRNITEKGFEVRLQEEENSDSTHLPEMVSWLVIEPGVFEDGSNLQAGLFQNVSHETKTIDFTSVFNGQPAVIAAMQTFNESDPATIRFASLSSSSIDLFLEEETSSDEELVHGNEDIALLAVEPGILSDENGAFVAESGAVNIGQDWQIVDFIHEYTKPVVIFGGGTHGDVPAEVRVRNVTPTSFEVMLQDWDYLNGSYANETFSYVVMEGSISSQSEYSCSDTTTVLTPGINLFATDNCDTLIEFSYVDSSQFKITGRHVFRQWTAMDDCGNSAVIRQTDTCALAAVKLRAYLSGAMIGNDGSGLMTDALRLKGHLPLTEPYSGLPGFVHKGNGGQETTTQEILEVTGDDAIVDWVFIEVRDAGDASAVMATSAALLQRDGDIITASGDSVIIFTNLEEGDYYVCVRHHNHLGLMSESIEYFSTKEVPLANFGQVVFPVNGQNEAGHETNDGKRKMWAGDMNSDGKIIFQGPSNDIFQLFTLILSNNENTSHLANFILEGYYHEDLNMDGFAIYQGPNNDRANLLYQTILAHPGNSTSLANFIVKEKLP